MYLTDWPEWFVQLHSLVEIHVGCQIGDRSLSVVEKGHSTTMWTKVYPILTTPSIGQLWTFYISTILLRNSLTHTLYEKAWTFCWLPSTLSTSSCPHSYWMTPELRGFSDWFPSSFLVPPYMALHGVRLLVSHNKICGVRKFYIMKHYPFILIRFFFIKNKLECSMNLNWNFESLFQSPLFIPCSKQPIGCWKLSYRVSHSKEW